MIPVYSSPRLHLANARTIVNGIADGFLGKHSLYIVRQMVMDIRNAVYYAEADGWTIVETWLAQATEILDIVVYQGRPFDDLDLGALKACLAEAACLLR